MTSENEKKKWKPSYGISQVSGAEKKRHLS